MGYQTIVVATDFSEGAEAAVEHAAELAKHFDAKLVLVHAYNIEIPIASPAMAGGYVLPEGFFKSISEQASIQTENAAKAIADEGIDAIGVAIDRPAFQAITEEAERRGADLIVMGTRGLTGLKHMAMGSVADRVVRSAPCPVLTVPAH
ncbi:MAG: universal stress protein [bacterium]|nr:universal stress protein [bacterium]